MNLGFESGLAGWTPVAASVRAATWDVYDEPDTTEGSKCLRFVGDTRPATSEMPGWARIEYAESFPLNGASSLIAAAWSRQTAGNGPTSDASLYKQAAARLVVIWLDASGLVISETVGSGWYGWTEGLYTDFNWMRMEVSAPSGATACRIALDARGADTAEVLYDSVGLRIGATTYGTDVDATFYRPVNRFRGWREVTSQTPGAVGAAPTAPITGVPVRPSAATRQLAVASLPRVGEALVGSDARASRAFYTWMQAVDKGLNGVAAIADEAKAGVDALPAVLGSPNGTIAGIPTTSRTPVTGRDSVIVTPRGAGYEVTLSGDAVSLGGMQFYGTDTEGTKGWQALSAGFAAGTGVTLETDDTGVTTIHSATHYTRIAADGSIRMAADSSLRISD